MALALRSCFRRSDIIRRGISSTSFLRSRDTPDVLPAQTFPTDREHFYPRIGSREVVGFGQNGSAIYHDLREYPCPAVRFREDDEVIAALREKEKGDWSLLTIDEKKTLYRAEFCSTYTEFNAPTGEWKCILALLLGLGTLTGAFMLFMHKYVLLPCRTSTKEWCEDTIRKNVAERTNWGGGEGYYYDYEKKKWK
eukprot:GHVO01014044.1.p1 GENE.GHVO01014044.1~~GHVO01014044.1.p1  ORF type:complete len:195 (-),score=11.29 GHVO01014044.1:467-1051(-)